MSTRWCSSPRRRGCLVSALTRPWWITKGRGSSMLKCLVCSHVDNIKESSNNEGKKGKKISLYYRLKCNKLRGVLRSLMETCSYLYSLENHFSHVSTYILQLWPDTSSMYPAMPDTCFLYISFSFCRIHALRILLCRIPLFHSSSTRYSAVDRRSEIEIWWLNVDH